MDPEIIWMLLGIFLILAEFAVPGLVVIFFGFSALIVGLLIWAGMRGEGPLPFVVFAAVSLGTLLLLRRQCKSWFVGRSLGSQIVGEDDDFLGREAIVASGFDNSRAKAGRVTYRGTQWDARTVEETPLKAGDPVKIIGRKDSVLIIEKITAN